MKVYNRQIGTSTRTHREYTRYVCVSRPGRLTEEDSRPPFYINRADDGRRWPRLDATTLADAKKEAQRIEDRRNAERKGVAVQQANEANGLRSKIVEYLDETKANKAKKTYQAYTNSLRLFRESCKKATVQEVNRKDMLAFKVLMAEKTLSDRSAYNNFLNVLTFFSWCSHATGAKPGDWPDKNEREPEEYTTADLRKLLKAAKPEERLLLNSFLCSGLRDGELAHMTYGDIDVAHSIWSVRAKPGWDTKTDESKRDIPVPAWLTKLITDRQKETSADHDNLIFPGQRGRANRHLIRVVQRVAKRAGVKGRVDDHKFRSTAITRWLAAGCTVPDVMRWCGHKDPKTILRYAAKVQLQNQEIHRKITQPFEQFASIGE